VEVRVHKVDAVGTSAAVSSPRTMMVKTRIKARWAAKVLAAAAVAVKDHARKVGAAETKVAVLNPRKIKAKTRVKA